MKRKMASVITMICLMMAFSTTVWAQSPSPAVVTQITYERAMELAIAHVGGGIVRDIELERKNGVMVYDMEVRFNGIEYDVRINATTEEIIRTKEDGRYNVNSASATALCLTSAEITFERAKEIAINRAGGGTVRDIGLERKNGALVFEVEVRIGQLEYDVRIDAVSGEVLRFRLDD